MPRSVEAGGAAAPELVNASAPTATNTVAVKTMSRRLAVD